MVNLLSRVMIDVCLSGFESIYTFEGVLFPMLCFDIISASLVSVYPFSFLFFVDS